jgi:hypothetical protein
MTEVTIDLSLIKDWDSFHAQFAEALGFPAFYGNNMNAWIDCMSDLSSNGTAGMTRVKVPRGEDLILALRGSEDFSRRWPELYAALLASTAQVNRRKLTAEADHRILLLLV